MEFEIEIDTPDEFVERMSESGRNPVETIQMVRSRFGLELLPARALVVAPEAITDFVTAQSAVGHTRLEARLAVKRRFTCGGKEALGYVDRSGLWAREPDGNVR